MVDIVVIRSNSIISNPRVRKIVKSLSKKYSTAVLGWNREGLSREKITAQGLDLSLFNLRAPVGKPTLAAYLPLYWLWTIFKLAIYRPKTVHACDLDSAIPSFIYKKIFRKKLVFDVCDRYAMGYIPTRYKTLYNLVNSLEEVIGEKSDTLVNVSEQLLNTFEKRPPNCAVIMNCSEDYSNIELSEPNSGSAHEKDVTTTPSNNDDEVLIIVYTGIIIAKRGLREIAKAIKDLNNVEFQIAGNPIDKELYDFLLKAPNIKCVGQLSHKDALRLQSRADVVVSLYDLDDPISNFSMGNKIFEAMMFGLPIITNVASDVINKTNCGILVDYWDIAQIRNAILKLIDDAGLRRNLGQNGRRAYLQKYNWKTMEQELYKVYDYLIQQPKA